MPTRHTAISRPTLPRHKRRWLQFRLRTLFFVVLVAGISSGVYVALTRSHVVVLTDENFSSLVLQSKKPVLVEFSASWCPPCRSMEPVVEELAFETCWWATVGKLDIDTCPKTVQQYQLSAIPTFLGFQNGKVVGRLVGTTTKDQLAEILREATGES